MIHQVFFLRPYSVPDIFLFLILKLTGSVEKKDIDDVSALLVCLICDFVCKQ